MPKDLPSQERPMRAIKHIIISGALNVFIRPGAPSMAVKAEDPDKVITQFNGDTLKIYNRGTSFSIGGVTRSGSVSRSFFGVSIGIIKGQVSAHDLVIGDSGPVPTVYFTLDGLESLDISGASDARLHDLDQDAFELGVSGSGDVLLDGRLRHLRVDVSGSGEVNARNLTVNTAELSASGVGDIQVSVKDAVKARVSGVGDISVWGQPVRRDVLVSGVGDIDFK